MKTNLSLLNVAVVAMACSLSVMASETHGRADAVQAVKPVDLRELAKVEYAFLPPAVDDALQDDARRSKQTVEESPDVSFAALDRHEPFGREGTMRLNFHGAYGQHIKSSDNRFGLLGAGISYFIIENLSLDAELNGLFIEQSGPDAWAGNFNLLFRWHFYSQETWSIYVDGGAGVFLATKRVPEHGTHFNFTPQAGGGVSFEVAPDIRMMLGVRWHHISNASTSSNNPGRDSVMGYVGVSLPF